MVLVAFLAGLGLSAVGLAVAVTRGIGLWRQTKRSGRAIAAGLATFDRRAQQAEEHLAAWDRSNAELQNAVERLRSSRARLQVLLDSLEHASTRVRWLRVFLPR